MRVLPENFKFLQEMGKFIIHTYVHIKAVHTYVTSSAKPCHVCTTTAFNFITSAYRYNLWLSIPSVYNIKCQLVCYSGGHFAEPQTTTETVGPMEGAN